MEDFHKRVSYTSEKQLKSFKSCNIENKFIRKKISSKTHKEYLNSNSKDLFNNTYNKNNKNIKLFKKHKSIVSDKDIFRRRLTQYYNTRKSKIKLSYESIKSRLVNNGLLINFPSLEDNQNNLIRTLKIENNDRLPNDIVLIKKFLIKCQLLELFQFNNCNEDIIDKLLVNCCINIKHKFIKKDEILYKLNDIIDNFYIIIKGKIGIYKPFNKIVYMSGFKYFQYIYDLYIKKEDYLLKIILEQNFNLFPIKESMFPEININLANKLIEKYNKNKKLYINIFNSVDDILKECFIKSFYYENENNKNITNNDDENKNFDYELLCNMNDQKIVYIFENHLLHEYIDGKYLDTINNKKFIENYNLNISENNKIHNYIIKEKRNYTAKIISDTHLCYFDLNNYYNVLLYEYRKILHRDAKFLTENFIFKKIKQFEEKYFPFFEYEEKNNNQYLFKENEQLDYIYFLKEGIIELSINKNILQIISLLNKLNMLKERKKMPNDENNTNTNSNNIDNIKLDKNINLNEQEIKLVIIEEKDIIGLECLYLDINYFYTAKLIGKKGNFYKIKKEKFLEILDLENETNFEKKYKNECERKIDFLIKRLSNLRDIKLKTNKDIKKEKIEQNDIKIYNYNSNSTNKNKKIKNIKKINELFIKRINNDKNNENNIFTNSFLTDKNKIYFLQEKKEKKEKIDNTNIKKIFNKINNQINSRNQNKLDKNNNNYNKDIQKLLIKNKINKKNSFYLQKNIWNESFNNNNSKNNTQNSNSISKYSLPKVIINKDKIKYYQKNKCSLASEKYLLNKMKKKIIYDSLFFSVNNSLNNNIKINNKSLINLEIKDKLKTKQNNEYMKKNISDINEFLPWKSFHNNINKESISIKRKNKKEKNNWYKNLDKLIEDNYDKDYSSINNWIYGIKGPRNNVILIADKE